MPHLIRGLLCLTLLMPLSACSGEETPDAPGLVGEASQQTDPAAGDPAAGAPAAGAPAAGFAPTEDERSIKGLRQLRQPWTGDLDGMLERRVIRLLTVYSPGRYHLEENGQERGLVKEMAREFEKDLNQQLGKRTLRVNVVIIPLPRGQLIPALLAGYGDIVAAGLTITEARGEQIDFTVPISKPVSELLVTGPSAKPLETIDSLAGETVYVRDASSYHDSVEALNNQFAARGLPPIDIQLVSEYLEDDDLIEMVDRGLLPWAIVDSYKPQQWEGVFEEITVREDLVLRESGRIAWAHRKDSPGLAKMLDNFLGKHREGTLYGNIMVNRYLRDFDWAAHALNDEDYQRFVDLEHLFRRYGEEYEVDYLLAAAQGFQESRLNQDARSHTGAIGVMQMLPSTARDKNVGIPDIHELEPNIEAGIKYVAFLRERYFTAPEVDRLNGTLLALAAYNAGPRRVINLRNTAEAEGYDPNVWFDNVEVIAAKEVGRETVQYVSNIFKYYLAYRFTVEAQEKRGEARQRAGLDTPEA